MKRMKIYVAGPLGGKNAIEYINNMKRMLDIALKIVKKGHQPYVPCLDLLLGIRSNKNWKYREYYDFNLPWVETCDALFFIAPSKGANNELKMAKKLGKIIFYSLDKIKVTRCYQKNKEKN